MVPTAGDFHLETTTGYHVNIQRDTTAALSDPSLNSTSMQASSRLLQIILPFGVANPEKYVAAKEGAKAYLLSKGFPEDAFVERPVTWGDQDMNRHVNNKVFMHWLESGRVTFFDHLVNTMPDQQGQVIAGRGTGLGLILGQVSVTYIKPVFAPDTIVVAHRIKGIETGKMLLESAIYSFAQQGQVAKGEAKLSLYDYKQLKAASWPPEVKALLEDRITPPVKL